MKRELASRRLCMGCGEGLGCRVPLLGRRSLFIQVGQRLRLVPKEVGKGKQ